MKLNNYTYKEIQDIMDRLCLMEHTKELITKMTILNKVKEGSSYAYKELLSVELVKELSK